VCGPADRTHWPAGRSRQMQAGVQPPSATAIQWLGVMPRMVSKSLSSRATRYTRRRPSTSPTVNVYNMPACQGRARLNGSSRRPAPTPTRTHTHAHPHTRAQARARDRALAYARPSTRTRTHARTRPRARAHHAHAHAHPHAPAPAPAHGPGTTHLDNLRRQHVSSRTGSKASGPGKHVLCAPGPPRSRAEQSEQAEAARPPQRRHHVSGAPRA